MERLNSRWGRFLAHLEAWFIDHEVLRSLYRNFYAISPQAYRSNHPSPRFVKRLKNEFGVKTIVSMRNADRTGQYLLEKEACDLHGIALVHHVMSSRSLPTKDQVYQAKSLLEAVEYPILIHCKSGADRAGLMSVFYRHFILHEPIELALQELHVKYGHFRWAETGKLDFFFDDFLTFQKSSPEVSFLEWIENHYDREALDARFHSRGWANILVNKILRRE